MILQTAIEHYGVEHQLNKVQEELKELIEALENWRNDKTRLAELVDEIADVMIMIDQLCLMQKDSFKFVKEVEERRKFKLNRLKQRIEDDINKQS